MERSLQIFGDGRIYEMEGEQVISVTETDGEVSGLMEALKFTLAKTFVVASPNQMPPDVAECRGSRQINAAGLELIKTFEKCVLAAYDDGGGVWTIGYGHTKGVRSGMTVTQAEAEQLLQADLEKFESFVENAVRVVLNDGQFSALVCFSFNVGVGQAGFGGSTLLKLLNQGSFEDAVNEFPRWNKVKGESWLGLTRRRKAEQALFLGQPWEPFLNYQEGIFDKPLKLTHPPQNGDRVLQLQAALKKAGMAIETDGIFGQGTDKAVRQFQAQAGLAVDGIVGAGTQKALSL